MPYNSKHKTLVIQIKQALEDNEERVTVLNLIKKEMHMKINML